MFGRQAYWQNHTSVCYYSTLVEIWNFVEDKVWMKLMGIIVCGKHWHFALHTHVYFIRSSFSCMVTAGHFIIASVVDSVVVVVVDVGIRGMASWSSLGSFCFEFLWCRFWSCSFCWISKKKIGKQRKQRLYQCVPFSERKSFPDLYDIGAPPKFYRKVALERHSSFAFFFKEQQHKN